ncbi:membrane protein [Candidatus Magnetobacterium bavaricum]|uniref:Membrane protein n=1 Tax=Candidatus Magnetobacterium bavaricum TaxID=29290 RepID=A0A0F3GZQ9_9BACT|nr:membrane protein [Candidatus Magnetobacterium bavaricum]
MLVIVALTPATSFCQPPTKSLSLARLSSSPLAAALIMASVSVSNSLIILTIALRLPLMVLKSPLYVSVIVGGISPLLILST